MRALRLTYQRLLDRREGCDPPPTPIASPEAWRGLRADVLPVVRSVGEGDTTKFIQQTHDALETESVVVPMRRRGRAWKTLCVSSQIGCARGCLFCETAQLGLLRNLTAGEIVGQVVAGRRYFRDVRNVVFMGMGEPLDNLEAVLQAVRVLTDPAGLSFSMARIALSTVGRATGIRRLAELGWRRLNVAISLNAPNDEIRTRIMPTAARESMLELRDALRAYPLRRCQFFMIEYVLIPGVNDAREHAFELTEYLRPVKGVVNVIPYNPRRDSPWPAPTEESVVRFLGWLQEAGQICKRRLTKGRDLMAACGQLGNRDLTGTRRSHPTQPTTTQPPSALSVPSVPPWSPSSPAARFGGGAAPRWHGEHGEPAM
ncbi:MAG TPA: 23S rRNA (adenine(2503)-C(2))-methyltransferase RlmN [Phycisphaerae bacterium]|nr:23S rRNA (adenine(2503)-C(2))-methyltransferase RlmN [Phycisphaerae bacterium]HNU45870.1 23S rRNA (adenine(2503)-C(2))-methyltransferase RlmN [Phycisphaerae bacterium]